ncbi:MAG: S9 family peptidase [Oscillospiraceae bacterium]|nr:S9 family peptidase [Oscillospiraceae bacterium]
MKPILVNDLLEYRFLSDLSFSPDGEKAVFVVKKANLENNSYGSNLYLYRDGNIRQLTALNKEGSYTWRNPNELLLFTVREEGDKKRVESGEQFTPVYRLYLDGGEAVKEFEVPVAVHELKEWKDGIYVLLGSVDANDTDYYKASKGDREKSDKRKKENKDYEVCDEVPFWFNGAGYINKQRTSLFVYDSKSGEMEIIPTSLDVSGFELLQDEVVFYGEEKEFASDFRSVMCAYDLKSHEVRTIRDDKLYSVSASALLGGRLVLLMSDNKKYGLNQDPSFYWFDPKTGEETLLYEMETAVGNSTGSDCRLGRARTIKSGDKAIYFLETRRDAAVLCALNSDGNKVTILGGEGAVDDFDVFEDTGTVLSVRLTAEKLQEVYISDLVERAPKQVSHVNDNALKDKYVALPEKMMFTSNNEVIDGWALKPIDFDSEKTYPAVLDIHGGPKTVYGEVFYHEMQVWASKGYFVFFCNPIGSDGRGDEFSDIRGKYGTCEYQNLMDFTDAIMERYPQIDPTKICVTGGSYGGFMTNWIVGHTERYCCAATQRSISNWISFAGVSDIGQWFTWDQQAATIDGDIEKLWWHSPLKYAKNVKTPTLFIHSDEDYRCPLEQGVQFFTAIRSRGVEAKMVVFHGENHELSRSGKPKHRMRRLEEITDWFEKHTKENVR